VIKLDLHELKLLEFVLEKHRQERAMPDPEIETLLGKLIEEQQALGGVGTAPNNEAAAIGRGLSVGRLIAEELEARFWHVEDLAKQSQLPVRLINQLILGQVNVSQPIAQALGNGFGTSAQFWIQLDLNYRARVAANV
jgi:plasmid maintenance system antidote protein VapI